MDKIGMEAPSPFYRAPESTYIEKPSDAKTNRVGKSILKKATAEAGNIKNLRFVNDVTHKQTRGKQTADNNYEVEVKITKLPLVEEAEDPSDKVWTKNDLKELEQAIQSEKERIQNGDTMPPEDVEALNQAETTLKRLENLFDGRRSLPFKLPKPSLRSFEREEDHLAAGTLTQTKGKSSIVKSETPSWPKDATQEVALSELHDRAWASLSPEAQAALREGGNLSPYGRAKDILIKAMLNLRTLDQKIALTKEELYDLYLDFDRKKEVFLEDQVKEHMSQTSNPDERQRLLNEFYYENLLPLGYRNHVDLDEIKKKLEEKMDLHFEKDTLEARFSSLSDREIVHFVEKKYLKKS